MAEAPAPAEVAPSDVAPLVPSPDEPPTQEYFIFYICDAETTRKRGWYIASDVPSDPNSTAMRDMAKQGRPWVDNAGVLGPTVVAHIGFNERTPDENSDLKWGRASRGVRRFDAGDRVDFRASRRPRGVGQGRSKTIPGTCRCRWEPDEGKALPELVLIGTESGGLVVRGVDGEPWMGFYEVVPDHPHKHRPQESSTLVENRLGKGDPAAVYRWTRPCTDEELAMEKPMPTCCCCPS